MKKKLLCFVVAGLAFGFAITVDFKDSSLSDLTLQNIEALARYEIPGVEIRCSQYCEDGIGDCWRMDWNKYPFPGCEFAGQPIWKCKC